jgi:selenide,water dikinase
MQSENLIVGVETSDDAAVYRLSDDLAIISTLDFFTPIVDDPYTFGQIAAANALSDIYAMGGKPVLALNIVGFPDALDKSILLEILQGGADMVLKAGALITGGHSVVDEEPKYGLSVTGTVHPERVLKNFGSRPGDLLILTKPLGTGIITTALKRGKANAEAYDEAVRYMTMLNREAAEAMNDLRVSACTDITGFGLMGHAFEMADASSVTFEFDSKAIPLMGHTLDFSRKKLKPGGLGRNRSYLKSRFSAEEGIEEDLLDCFFDPQTSGGLLFSLHADDLERFHQNMGDTDTYVVGRVLEKESTPLRII